MANKKGNVVSTLDSTTKKISKTAEKTKNAVVNRVAHIDITPEEVIKQAMQLPIAKVDRGKFLRRELKKYYSKEVIDKAIEFNPAYAGVPKWSIEKIAKDVITYETRKVSTISFAAGLPGGIAMAATVPADMAQYFAFTLRTLQELAYLFGFEEFSFEEDEVSAKTMNELMVFLGVMFGVQGANNGIRIIAHAAAEKVSKSLAQKALTQTTIYPIVKKIATKVGIRMTKQIFADGVSKVIPVVGGVACGGLTLATFRPGCNKLRKSLADTILCDPEYYKKLRNEDAQETNLEHDVIDIDENDVTTENDIDSSEAI